WFKPIPSFGTLKLKREWKQSPAPLQSCPACVVVRKVVLQRRQKKSPETAALFLKRIEVTPFDHRRAEALSTISSSVQGRASRPDIRIQGIPVGLTQLRQCGSRGRVAGANRIHDAPTCGLKSQDAQSRQRHRGHREKQVYPLCILCVRGESLL